MEWNISFAIFLATKRVLFLEAIFSIFWSTGSAGWRKTTLISVLFAGPRPLVLNRAGLTSVAATEPVCWAGNRWVRVVYRPQLNRAGLHLLEVMCCYRAWHTGLSPGVARRQMRDMPISKGSCNENAKLGSRGQSSFCSFLQSLQRRKAVGWNSRLS
jgi:hypothetical protein